MLFSPPALNYLQHSKRPNRKYVRIFSALTPLIDIARYCDGNTNIAIAAIRAASSSHMFLSPYQSGQMSIYRTRGNPLAHIIMRGGKMPSNHESDISAACDNLRQFELPNH